MSARVKIGSRSPQRPGARDCRVSRTSGTSTPQAQLCHCQAPAPVSTTLQGSTSTGGPLKPRRPRPPCQAMLPPLAAALLHAATALPAKSQQTLQQSWQGIRVCYRTRAGRRPRDTRVCPQPSLPPACPPRRREGRPRPAHGDADHALHTRARQRPGRACERVRSRVGGLLLGLRLGGRLLLLCLPLGHLLLLALGQLREQLLGRAQLREDALRARRLWSAPPR